MRRRDDHAGVGVILAHQIGHGGSGDDAQTLDVRAHAAQTGGQGSFQHITGLAGAAGQHGGSAASDEHRHLTGQVCTGHAAHTVGTKILSHSKYLT